MTRTPQTKARTCAQSYLPSKPDPYGIQFYVSVSSEPGTYLFSLSDNRSGNTSLNSPAQAYCRVFPDLQRILKKMLQDNPDIHPELTSALWVLQMAHECKK